MQDPQCIINGCIDVNRLNVGLGLTGKSQKTFDDLSGPPDLLQRKIKVIQNFLAAFWLDIPGTNGIGAGLDEA